MEERIRLLLKRISGISTNDLSEISEYLDHNELGLAYETLCAILEEKGIQVNKGIENTLIDMGKELGIKCWIFEKG